MAAVIGLAVVFFAAVFIGAAFGGDALFTRITPRVIVTWRALDAPARERGKRS
jgi:hypothetical protein